MLYIGIGLFLAVLLRLIFLYRSKARPRSRGPTYAIGAQMEAARQSDRTHFQNNPQAASPIREVKYDFWQGDLYLTSPSESGADAAIRDFLSVFIASPDSKRAEMRAGITMDQFYELLTFSRRMAVFGLRTGNPDVLRFGLSAVAAIDTKRVDYRDVLMALSLLHHSCERNGLNAPNLFEQAARLAAPNTAELIAGFLARPPEQKNIRASWGYDEVVTDARRGFIGRGFQPYQPDCDLAEVAINVAKAIASDRYQPDSITIATDLPSVWFGAKPPGHSKARDSALAGVKGVATVGGKLRRTYDAHNDAQQFTVFVSECANEEDSLTLRSLIDPASRSATMLGIAEGPLFSLIVARSLVSGVPRYETSETIERFREPLENLLRGARRR